MADYAIELATVVADGSEAKLPYELRVDHHIAGPVELRLDALRGGHALHAAVAVCVFNNLTRLAQARGVVLEHAAVRVRGGFDQAGHSTGITFDIETRGGADDATLTSIASEAAAVSTVVEALRHPSDVTLGEITVVPT